MTSDLYSDWIPFNSPVSGQLEEELVLQALRSNHRHGSGQFTALAIQALKKMTHADHIFLTHSCTGALELAMLLLNVREGDEVILPSFTFTSTANAIVLRGGIPVFADIDSHTQCIDPHAAEKLITQNTRAIMPVHYAGISCDMTALCSLAEAYSIAIVEDAAQAVGSFSHDIALGCFGNLGALSFHDSKNISAGEGGAIIIGDSALAKRAEILIEKGTNRSQFTRGEVDKYTWCDIGSSLIPSEITAAFLLGQLERIEFITQARLKLWDQYHAAFLEAEDLGVCSRPHIPEYCMHNGHIYYLILNSQKERSDFIAYMRANRIACTFHYVPLHSSPAGKYYGRAPLPLPNTDRAGFCLVRLPLFPEMTLTQQDRVINTVMNFLLRKKVIKYFIAG